MKITRIDTTYFRPGATYPGNPIGFGCGFTPITVWSVWVKPTRAMRRRPVWCTPAIAGMLLGRDPRDIDRIWADFYRTFDFQVTGGTEMRVLSAIDLALWDLLGKSLNVPVYRLLGGKSNPEIRLYNTCFGHRYDFNKEPEKIMHELIDRYGIKAIKIWPFDRAALRNQHEYVTPSDIEEGLAPVRKLRDTFGNDIEILMEFHSGWDLTSAVRIARALEPYRPMWLEDMLLPGNFSQYRILAESTSNPSHHQRTHGGAHGVPANAGSARGQVCDVRCDLVRRTERGEEDFARMAEAFELPVAPHTAGGPLLFYATTHLTTALTNVAIQESCQVFYETTWPTMLENPLVPHDGKIRVPELPGLGMQIKPEVWTNPAAITRTTTA